MLHPHRSVFRTLAVVGGASALATVACLDRPVAPARPHTTNVFVEAVTQTFVDKIDLLFMIDNSVSMKDKQEILEQAVPVLVERLVTPRCLDAAGNSVGSADGEGRCATGVAEFQPVKDIHIGVITSSLGSHGGSECLPQTNDVERGRTPDDRAELLPRMRPNVNLSTWNDQGFLAWDPEQAKQPLPGERNIDTLVDNVRAELRASGEVGCGYESSLEAWYRFLVDPEPPSSMSVVDNRNVRGPVNGALLAQRSAFLRPDSLLAIVMLTDENDCSINDDDGAQGFYVTSTGTRIPRASSACANDPNDRCCHTCAVEAPEGCTPNVADAECSKKLPDQNYATLTLAEDSNNLRCFDHKRRFGIDFLYSTQRYIDALTQPTVKNRAGVDVPNPIFVSPSGERRPADQVVLAGIIGVPWQDIATDASRTGPGLEYLDAAGLERAGRWPLILGDPARNEPPADPLMRESVAPRSGLHPLLSVPVAPITSQNPTENPINGHEQNIPGADDLQYACTFELPVAHPCGPDNSLPCDCNADERINNRPLCDYSAGTNTDGIQRYGKAYPGLRHLEVLKGVGNNGIVASICPKFIEPGAGLEPASDPNYGYNPAVASILDIFRERLGGQCLPRQLDIETDQASPDFGKVPCSIIEAVVNQSGDCRCDADKGRAPVTSADLRQSSREVLREHDQCGGTTGVDCGAYCLCEIEQLTGDERDACLAGSNDPDIYGYCYVDADLGIGNPKLVENCEANEKRLLRWVGDDLPANGSTMLLACLGAAF
jgi:hypothetical protein